MGIRTSLVNWLNGSQRKGSDLHSVQMLGLMQGVTPEVQDRALHNALGVCAWVYACVSKIATTCGEAPLVVKKRQGASSEWKDGGATPLAQVLEYANSDQDMSGLIEMTAVWLALMGTSYWQCLRVSENAPPEGFRVLPSDLVEPIPGQGKRSNLVSGYRILTPERPVLPDTDVIRFRLLGPNPILGMPPMQPLRPIVNMFSALTRYKYSIVANGGIPATVLKMDKPVVDDAERELFRVLWGEWRSPGNDGRPFLIGSEMDIQPVGVEPDKIAGLELTHETRETICGVYGVPPGVVGLIQDTNYNTAKIQRKSFWSETIIPMYLRKIESGLNEQLCWQYERGGSLQYRAEFNLAQIEALQEDKKAEAETARIWVVSGIRTPNEVRADHGWEPMEGGDQLYKPSSGGATFNQDGKDPNAGEQQDQGDDKEDKDNGGKSNG